MLTFFIFTLNMVILASLGFPLEVTAIILIFDVIWGFFTHSDYLPAMPTISKILITPFDHSNHHESSHEKMHSNYGNVTSIYDHIFGTYDRNPKTYKYGCNANYNTETIFEAQLTPLLVYFKQNGPVLLQQIRKLVFSLRAR